MNGTDAPAEVAASEIPAQYHDEIKDCYKTTSTRIYGALRRFTQGDHELSKDLVQDTFEAACQDWHILRDLTDEERGARLTRVAVNKAIDVIRHNETERKKRPVVYERNQLPEADVYRESLTLIAIQRFVEVTNKMTSQQGRVAYLHWRWGWKQCEIAEALGITPGRVSQLVAAARATLRHELGPYVPFESSEPEGGADRVQ